ncbi:MAG: glycosyltransferase family 2 protein [Deltaproteobacteria bacterium]|nr:glycosyltransferase family 2 protein [Deltaproteobacteria bacterium]
MATLAFSIIGHNEEKCLPRMFESIGWADQIIYVDCESTDGSLAVARRYTPHVFTHPNVQNLNISKTHGMAQATTDWIFYLDADEVIPPDLANEIQQVIASDPPHAAYLLPRRNFFFGRWVRRGGKYPDNQLRLFRRGRAHFPCKDLHERLAVDGSIGRLKHPFDHHTTVTPATTLYKMDRNTTFYARELYRKGVKPSAGLGLKMMVLKPLRRFVSRAVLKLGFLDGPPGMLLILVDGWEQAMIYFKLWYYHQFPQAAGDDLPAPDSIAKPKD